jgi:hypothetical protein
VWIPGAERRLGSTRAGCSDPDFDGDTSCRNIDGGAWNLHHNRCGSAARRGVDPETLLRDFGVRLVGRPSTEGC